MDHIPPGTRLQLRYKGEDKVAYYIKVKKHMSSNVVYAEDEQLYDLDDFDWVCVFWTKEDLEHLKKRSY